MTRWPVGGGTWNTVCQCGAPATHKLAAIAYCQPCHQRIVGPWREHHQTLDGTGQHISGLMRPDHGRGMADLACTTCDATWVGIPGEPCTWCADALEHMQQWQTEILLTPDLPDPDDGRYTAAVGAWAQRLGRGVSAALVTTQQAIGAIQREERR